MEAFLLIFGGIIVLAVLDVVVSALRAPSARSDAWARNHGRARR